MTAAAPPVVPVAPVVDTEAWHAGAGLVGDVASVVGTVRSGAWVDAGVNVVAGGANVVGLAMDPLGSALSWGVSWVLDHLHPLCDWFDELAGDADQVTAYARTWMSVGAELRAAGDALDGDVAQDLAAMSGLAVGAYRGVMSVQVGVARVLAHAAEALGDALVECARFVRAVHDLLRDAIAEIVSSAVSALNVVSAARKVTALVARWADRIGPQVSALARTVECLKGLVGDAADAIAKLVRNLEETATSISTKNEDVVDLALRSTGFFITALGPFLPGARAGGAESPPGPSPAPAPSPGPSPRPRPVPQATG